MQQNDKNDGMQFVVFSINNQMYSFYIEEVVEILRVPTIATIPGIHKSIEGVINLRGSILPVVNLHERFQFPLPKAHKKNRIIVVQGQFENIGLMVEEVRMVTHFEENDVEPPSGQHIKDDVFIGYAKHEGQIIGILNLHKVLYGFERHEGLYE